MKNCKFVESFWLDLNQMKEVCEDEFEKQSDKETVLNLREEWHYVRMHTIEFELTSYWEDPI